MSAPIVAGVAVLGGCGAVLRLLLDGAVSARLPGSFPAGTLAVNLSGALVLGTVVFSEPTSAVAELLGAGLIGAFTTFSTWMLETQRLAEDGEGRTGALNLALSLLAGVTVAWIGGRLGTLL